MFETFAHFYTLRRNVYKDLTLLKAMQFKKLKRLLIYVYNNTDFYQKLFDEHKFNPELIKRTDELKNLPVLEKNDIKENLESIVPRSYNRSKLLVHNTSGSTGIPLTIYGNPHSEAYNRALKYRAFVENGFSFRDVVVEITSPEHLNYGNFWFQQYGVFRRHKLSILLDHTELFKQINMIKPDVIECYPSVLNLITLDCKKKDLTFRPKIIFTTAELLLSTWRNNIVQFFDCDIRDMYGSAEFYRLAWECEKHQGYHLDMDAHVIEFVDQDDNPVIDKDGYITITGLYNFVFPLIRYKIGDIAKLKNEECTCGRSLPLIDSIQGREDDYIKLPSGKTISPRKINLLDSVKGVREYVTIQTKKDVLKVQIVKNGDFSEKTIESIKKQILKGCLGEAIKIDVELVKNIKKNAGKIRTVMSSIN